MTQRFALESFLPFRLNRLAAEVSERPADAREAIDHAAEDEARCGKRRVERKSDERHQPILLHRLDADG